MKRIGGDEGVFEPDLRSGQQGAGIGDLAVLLFPGGGDHGDGADGVAEDFDEGDRDTIICLALAAGRTRTSGYLPTMAIETRNVVGSVLKPCSLDPLTGWHRDGCCRTGAGDQGVHVVCARVNDKFLQFSKSRGNDLTTPRPEFGFPGLTAGNQWCLCAARWQEAFEAGCAPDVVLEATHESALEFIDLESLKAHAC